MNSTIPVLARVQQLRTRWRLLVLAEGLGIALAAVLGLFLGAVALDNWLHLPWLGRLAFQVVLVAGAAWLFAYRVVIPLRRPFTDEAVAVHLENQLGGTQNRLINTVQLGRQAPSQFIDKVLTENTNALENGPPLERALPMKRAAQWLGAFLLLALAIFAYAKFFPNYFQNATARLTRPFSHIQPLTQTTLEVAPGSVDVPLGGVVEIQMVTGGRKPGKVVIEFRRDAGKWDKVELSPYAPDRYAHTFLDVRQSIVYFVAAGDAKSDRFQIRPVEGPGVTGVTVLYRYPEYTGLADKLDKTGRGDVFAPAGTQITLTFRANRPLKSANLTLPGVVKQIDGTTFEWSGTLERAGTYQLALVDSRGMKNSIPIERDFKVQVDRLPVVELKPKDDFALTPDEGQPVIVSAADDFGLREIRLLAWKKEGDTPKVIWTQAGGKTQQKLEQPHSLTVKELGAIGETWTLVAEASDFNPGKDRQHARSQPLHVKLVSTRSEVDSSLMAAVELKRGLAELIRLQQANLDLGNTIAPDFELAKVPLWTDARFAALTMKHYENAGKGQAELLTKAAALDKAMDVSLFRQIHEALDGLIQREMPLAAELLKQGLAQKELPERREKLLASLQVQPVILATLQALLEQTANLETEIALQTVVAGLEKILKIEQDLLSQTTSNPSTALADKQKEATGWLVALQKRLDETTARMSVDKVTAAKLFVDLNAAFKEKNLPPVMQAAESALRAARWPVAVQAETQTIEGLQALLTMIRNELAKVAEQLVTGLRDALKQAAAGSEAEASIYQALKDAEALAKEAAGERKGAPSRQANVPERPIGEEMLADNDIAKYVKRLQDAAKVAEAAKEELKNDFDPDKQRAMAEKIQSHRDPKEIDPTKYHLADKKGAPRNQDWSAFENAQGGPKSILTDPKPDDMEDLIGDLIQDEEKLRDKMVTSFMQMNTDLKDTGAVGDLDSPMGNYAMRGKTGNQMPQATNIGGRSRSGRQGPTFGEMGVSKAKDMAGRPGEGMNTPDQKGYVQEEKVEGDKGADPSTATGGKHAGQDAQEGEVGKPRAGDAAQYQGIAASDIIHEGKGTPDIDVSTEALKRDLASRQAQLVKRAEEITKQFEQLFTPSADWFEGVDLMRQIEEEIRRWPSEKLWQLQAQALEKLKRVYREITPGASYDFDVGLSRSANPLVLNPAQQSFPKPEEDALKKYYRRLAEDQ